MTPAWHGRTYWEGTEVRRCRGASRAARGSGGKALRGAGGRRRVGPRRPSRRASAPARGEGCGPRAAQRTCARARALMDMAPVAPPQPPPRPAARHCGGQDSAVPGGALGAQRPCPALGAARGPAPRAVVFALFSFTCCSTRAALEFLRCFFFFVFPSGRMSKLMLTRMRFTF